MNLPKPALDRKSAMDMWLADRSNYAKEQVILANVGIVAVILKRMGANHLDDDLFSAGLVGLVKAINAFDAGKGYEFSTFAGTVIENEMRMIFRKKRIVPVVSLDEENEDGFDIAEMIAGDDGFEDDLIADIQIKEVLGKLPDSEMELMRMRASGKTQKKVAKILGVSQSYVSRMEKKIIERIKKGM